MSRISLGADSCARAIEADLVSPVPDGLAKAFSVSAAVFLELAVERCKLLGSFRLVLRYLLNVGQTRLIQGNAKVVLVRWTAYAHLSVMALQPLVIFGPQLCLRREFLALQAHRCEQIFAGIPTDHSRLVSGEAAHSVFALCCYAAQ